MANAAAVTDLLPVGTAVTVLFGYVMVVGLVAVLALSKREVALAE